MECAGCSLSEVDILSHFCRHIDKDKEALDIFEAHGVIRRRRSCGKCGRELNVSAEGRFECHKRFRPNPKKKTEVRCNFRCSQFEGTWLEKAKIPPSVNLLFINGFLRKTFYQDFFSRNFGLAARTIVDWKNFCGEVCVRWLEDQAPIGGPGKVVEIDESKFGKRKYHVGRRVDGVWVFGGVERETQKRFIVPVEKRDAATLLPLCQKYILPGTTIHSDCWKAYNDLQHLGYTHLVVNHSQHFVDPVTGVHTNTIESLWKDIKGWVLRAGNKKAHYHQYFARYLFCHSHPDHSTIFHHFLREIARCYPPPQ